MAAVVSRTRRTERRPERTCRLTERDVSLLDALARLRFATTRQLARLEFAGSSAAANKRLRKLLDAGLVRPWVRDLAKENVYSLDRAGARLLGEQDGTEMVGVPRGLDGNLDHLLAINQVRVSLAVGLGAAAGEIPWFRPDWELRARFKERVIPDALFSIRWNDNREQALALEVDNHTRSPRRFLGKILGYRRLLARGRGMYGLGHLPVLVVGRDSRAVDRYRVSVDHTRLGSGIWWTTRDLIDAEGACGKIWSPSDGSSRYSLRDVGSLPYGKEGLPRQTDDLMRA